jgi:hypothetical protein
MFQTTGLRHSPRVERILRVEQSTFPVNAKQRRRVMGFRVKEALLASGALKFFLNLTVKRKCWPRGTGKLE